MHLDTRQPVGFGAEAQHDLVAVDGVDVKVNGDARAACSSQLIQRRVVLSDDFQRLGKLVEDDRLCLDSVPLLQAFIRHRHGTATLGPSCGGSTASSTVDPTAYPRRATSKGNSDASSRTLDVPPPCHWARSDAGAVHQTTIRSTHFLSLCDTAALDRDDPYGRWLSLSLGPVRLVQQPRARFGPSHRPSIAGFMAGAGRA